MQTEHLQSCFIHCKERLKQPILDVFASKAEGTEATPVIHLNLDPLQTNQFSQQGGPKSFSRWLKVLGGALTNLSVPSGKFCNPRYLGSKASVKGE